MKFVFPNFRNRTILLSRKQAGAGDLHMQRSNARYSRVPHAAFAENVDSFPPLAGFTVGQSDQAWAPRKGKTNRRESGEEEFGLVKPYTATFNALHKVF